MQLIDITHGFYEGMPSYPASWYPKFSLDRVMTPESDPAGTSRLFSQLHLFPHNGTHIETGRHFFPSGRTIDEVPLEVLFGRACVADLSHKQELDPIAADDLDKAVGEFWVPGDRLLIRTDYLHTHWGREDYWDRPPYLTSSAADWAVENGAVLVGLDCLTERPGDLESPVHRTLLAADIPILEYITDLHLVGASVVTLLAMPIKVADAEAAPARAVVMVDETPRPQVER
ncbi:cyclase family protein [Micromonospora sp. NPDC049559]|uniref:cyclase family protein n=1 Tax=Micromonospora sp. NPDC049559 TaxID=3155923 RepID=UPI00343A2168